MRKIALLVILVIFGMTVSAFANSGNVDRRGDLTLSDGSMYYNLKQLATSAPGRTPPGNQNPGNQDPGNQNPGNQKPGNQNPGNQNPGNQNPGNQNPGNQNPGNQPPR